jgi:hypothetical protein
MPISRVEPGYILWSNVTQCNAACENGFVIDTPLMAGMMLPKARYSSPSELLFL